MSVADSAAVRPFEASAPEVRPWVRGRAGGRLTPVADLVALALVVLLTGADRLLGAVFALVVLGLLAVQGLHRVRICSRVSDQVPQLAVAAGLPLVGLAPWLTGGELVVLAGCAFGGLLLARGALCAALRAGYRRGVLNEPTLVVGRGELAARITRSAQLHPEFGVRPRPVDPSEVDRLGELVAAHGSTRVLLCPDDDTAASVVAAVRAHRPLPVDVWVVPRLPELGTAVPRAALDELWGVPLVPLRRLGHGRAGAWATRVLDVVLGGLLLAVSAPLLLALAVAVRLDSPGPAFFRQLRVTGPGRTSEVLKLRTLRVGAEQGWAVPTGDCTRLGRWLRRTHLDELPQLVNVLRGDMSLVGPRPERPHYAERFGREKAHYADRHRVPGGMTGWAQVHGLHGDTSIAERAHFDNQYIEHRSPWWDAVIVLRTVAVVLRATVTACLRRELGGRSARHRRPARPRRPIGAHRRTRRGATPARG
ncbi:sugar transferase [Saccharopolyspora hordei]|uniref:Lipopolysaccharide/colanic/teichoic acid biosynthesis glycosyltransferase n=1 Tax=Saccharopolyspora hordei TaxID=1838 RepID=A0A853ASM2_9PSEU|nr:sugar transferase [Saccharopolyspora hordei]NYI85157.1 lipopolysaccharide/colanic/teichoic acid biosynthesis glycosyltransferase [Saccharopolyspora hordei]